MTALEDRTEWLAWRRAGIGASDVAGILGLSPWASPYSVWASKMNLTPDDDMSEAQEMGLALEPAIATLFHKRTGMYVVGQQERLEHPDHPWARATIDGMACDHQLNIVDWERAFAKKNVPYQMHGTVQSKTTSDAPAKWEQEIPIYYRCQVQWEMWVAGVERCWLPTIHAHFGLKFRVYEMARDDSDIEYIVNEVSRFYNEHVVTGTPPETDGSVATTDALSALPVDPGQTVDLSSCLFHIDRLRQINADLKALEEQKDAATNAIKAAMGEATEGVIDGAAVATWRTQERKTLDGKKLRADFPNLPYDLYESTTTSRVFRLSTKKEK